MKRRAPEALMPKPPISLSPRWQKKCSLAQAVGLKRSTGLADSVLAFPPVPSKRPSTGLTSRSIFRLFFFMVILLETVGTQFFFQTGPARAVPALLASLHA